MSECRVQHHHLADDGLVPNNPRLALILYRTAFGPCERNETAIIARFRANGWSNGWVNGIYPFHHYHATTHEVLGIAAGYAEVQFGGPSGRVVRLAAGDAVLIPAGVGHCRIGASADLSVVGAYPGGGDWDLVRATPEARAAAIAAIARVPPPCSDPLFGAGGPACRADSLRDDR
jgi:uncharacterized protein YjlB